VKDPLIGRVHKKKPERAAKVDIFHNAVANGNRSKGEIGPAS
jgi:hypothetical protein